MHIVEEAYSCLQELIVCRFRSLRLVSREPYHEEICCLCLHLIVVCSDANTVVLMTAPRLPISLARESASQLLLFAECP